MCKHQESNILDAGETDEPTGRSLAADGASGLRPSVRRGTADTTQRTERRFGYAGVLRINRAHMARWQVTSDNVRLPEAIVNAPAALLVLDSRPYVERLCEFGIFFTLSPL